MRRSSLDKLSLRIARPEKLQWYEKFHAGYQLDINLQPVVVDLLLNIINLPPLVVEISWSKHRAILDKCKNRQQREFYIKATKKFGWTKDVLIHQIENQTFEKFLQKGS